MGGLFPDNDKKHFCISIAGHTVEIETLYNEVYTLCKDYLCKSMPDIRISISEADIEAEKALANTIRHIHSKPYLETLAVYRKISEIMLQHDCFLMHGAVLAYDKKAYMFSAESGTGKTTHIRKWLDHLDDAFVINGDKPLIKVSNNEIMACGTPWCGKEQMGTNVIVPLQTIAFMERGENNSVESLSFSRAFPFLLQQTYRPDNQELMRKTLNLISRMNGKVQFYKFTFNNMKDDAFEVAYRALTGEINQ